MKQQEMIQGLRAEIAKLQQVLNLLVGGTTETESVRRPGRPKASGGKATSFNPEEFVPAKRTMSAEGKARIAAAQKKRWAAQKAAPTKRSRKTVLAKSSAKSAPAAAKKNASAGKGTGSTRAKTQPASAKRTGGIAKKVVASKTADKKATRPVTKQAATPAAGAQRTA